MNLLLLRSCSCVTIFLLFSNLKYLNAQIIKPTNLNTFGIDQNLSSANIRKIIKDKNNFLWLSTQDGLNKFEGSKITQFTKGSINPKRQLIGIDCFGLEYKAGEDFLYVLTSYEGLNIININTNEVVHAVTSAQLIGSNESVYFTKIVRLEKYLFIVTDKGRLIKFNVVSKKVDNRVSIPRKSEEFVTDLFLTENLVSIVLSNSGLVYYDPKTVMCKSKIELPIVFIGVERSISININTHTWIATDRGIKVVDYKSGKQIDAKTVYPWFPNYLLNVYTTVIYEKDNQLYISNINGMFVVDLNTGAFSELLDIRAGEGNNFLKSANSILCSDQQIWIGGTSGMAQINVNSTSLTSFYSQYNNTNIKIGHTYGMRTNAMEQVFVGCDDAVYLVNTKKHVLQKVIKNETFFSMEKLSGESFIMSGSKKLWLYSLNKVPQKAASVYPELKPIENDVFISIEKLGQNKILLASQLQTGVFLWDMEKHTLQHYNANSKISITDLLINRILVVDEERFFLVSESTIQLIDFKKDTTFNVFERQQSSLQNAGFFMDMCRQGNNYYIAGYGIGIIKLNDKFQLQKIISTQQGITNIGLFKIFSVGDSLIVATSNNGLIVYHTKQDKVRTYFQEDGLHSNSFEETSGYQQGDSIYIGGLKGFTIFNTRNYRTNNNPPKLYFSTITWETSKGQFDTTNLFISKQKIPNDATQARISFTGLNYINPNRVTYSYRIKGLQDNWSIPKSENFVTLIGTPPGTYTLEVKAANEDGVECKPISMQLHFLPKWYQTWWFKLAVALAIAALLYILYAFRIRQLKKVYSVRQKISSDLHDDIGSTLSSINMYSQIAQLQPNNLGYANTIQENTQEVLQKLDDIVWATNPKNDQVKNLAERIDAFARPLLQAKGVQFVFEVDDSIASQKISEAARQNLFLICKEAINNTAKYATATTCTVTLHRKSKSIHCTITDDGIGFDTTQQTERNGLLNMQQRADAVKGKLELISSPGNGTRLQVQIPL